jgi:glycosyltransferase involved in cell wall biosynthesis
MLSPPSWGKLVVVSDTVHYRRGEEVVAWGPTVREIDQLATLFGEVVHVAPVIADWAPRSCLPYESARIRVRQVRLVGGERVADKWRVLLATPAMLRAVAQELRSADAVHLRCPSNIGMMSSFTLPFLRRPKTRWIKYGGNWSPRDEEPWSYELQRRWLLLPWHRALVTVNGNWPGQPRHVLAFLNPCLTERELGIGRAAASRKRLEFPVRMLFVGRLEPAKGVLCALEVQARLRRMGLAVQLDFIGDGPLRSELERRARERGIEDSIAFHGWLPRDALAPHYETAHLLLFPTRTEGWPKVLSEAMAFGVIPIASRVSSIPEYLLRFKIGTVADPDDVNGFVDGVMGYLNTPQRWLAESPRAANAAEEFTYARYLDRVTAILGPLHQAH